jgi:hypothetical protein
MGLAVDRVRRIHGRRSNHVDFVGRGQLRADGIGLTLNSTWYGGTMTPLKLTEWPTAMVLRPTLHLTGPPASRLSSAPACGRFQSKDEVSSAAATAEQQPLEFVT